MMLRWGWSFDATVVAAPKRSGEYPNGCIAVEGRQ